jgi:crossover junction endodeoxyribonuclease RusA
MDVPELPLPFGFCVVGTPVSHQSRSTSSRGAWREKVRAAAAARIAVLGGNHGPKTGAIRLTITYYHEGPAPDADNVIKLIQDSLNGIAYADDEQVVEVRSRRRDLNGAYKVRHARIELLEAMAQGDEFVHVLVEDYVDGGDLSE